MSRSLSKVYITNCERLRCIFDYFFNFALNFGFFLFLLSVNVTDRKKKLNHARLYLNKEC